MQNVSCHCRSELNAVWPWNNILCIAFRKPNCKRVINWTTCEHPSRFSDVGDVPRTQTIFFWYLFFFCDDVIKWKPFSQYWPFVRGIHRLPVDSPYKGQWREALMFSLICAWTYGWTNNWWFETSSHSLWCHCNVLVFTPMITLVAVT